MSETSIVVAGAIVVVTAILIWYVRNFDALAVIAFVFSGAVAYVIGSFILPFLGMSQYLERIVFCLIAIIVVFPTIIVLAIRDDTRRASKK